MKFHNLKDLDNKVPKPGSFKQFLRIQENGGRIVKGVNTTVDVGPNEITKQAAKFGFKVDKDGRPATLSKKVKGSSTNVLFNLGLSESETDKALTTAAAGAVISGAGAVSRLAWSGLKYVIAGILNIHPDDVAFVRQQLSKQGKAALYDLAKDGVRVEPAVRKTLELTPKMRGDAMNKMIKDIEAKSNAKYGRGGRMGGGPVGLDGAGGNISSLDNKTGFKPLESKLVDNTTESVLQYSMLSNLSEAKLGELASASEIYVDMDGVLADFFGEWAKLMKVDDYRKIDNIDINVALQAIRDTEQFWLDLPLLPQAKQLLNLIKQVKGEYNICSTPLADDPKSEPHKREWIEKNLAFFPPKNVYITHNKPQYATNKDGTPNILVDDFGKNVASWEAAGGIGFKYKDHKFERTAKELKQHIEEPVEEESVQEWAVPALKGGKYALKIGNWLWRNKWAIGFFVGAWKTIDWVGDALAWLEKWLNHPVTKALGKYGLPAIGIAVALYGGKRLWDELENIKDERELDKMVRSFVPNPQEVEKELEEPIAEEDKINKKIVQKAQGMMKPMYSSEIAAMVEDEFEAIREAALKRYKKSNGKIDLYTAYTMAIEDEFPEIPNPIFVFQYMTDPVDPNHQDIVPQEAEDGSWADRADKEYQQNPKDGGFDGKIKGRWFAIKADRDSYMDQGMEPEDALDKAAERHGVDPEEVEKWIAAGNAVKIKEAKAVMYATATKMAKESLLWSIETGQNINESLDKIIQVLEEMDRRHLIKFRHRYKESIDENFADGKVKGKSKPGRVKKSGASCSSSVTELRKKAKNASGERAKMYHWCANMKSGQAKK